MRVGARVDEIGEVWGEGRGVRGTSFVLYLMPLGLQETALVNDWSLEAASSLYLS